MDLFNGFSRIYLDMSTLSHLVRDNVHFFEGSMLNIQHVLSHLGNTYYHLFPKAGPKLSKTCCLVRDVSSRLRILTGFLVNFIICSYHLRYVFHFLIRMTVLPIVPLLSLELLYYHFSLS